jgi:hypothetical protein
MTLSYESTSTSIFEPSDYYSYIIIIKYFLNNIDSKVTNIQKISKKYSNIIRKLSVNLKKDILYVQYNLIHNIGFWYSIINNDLYDELLMIIIESYDIFIQEFTHKFSNINRKI